MKRKHEVMTANSRPRHLSPATETAYFLYFYSSDATNGYGARGGEFCGNKVGVGVESGKIVFLAGTSYYLFRYFCCMMYRLATIHFVTDRQTYSRTDQTQLRSVSCQ